MGIRAKAPPRMKVYVPKVEDDNSDYTPRDTERKAPHSLFDRPDLLSSQMDGEVWTVERWINEAATYEGLCRKCGHGTRGKYIPLDRYGDCGNVEGCQMCSWEVVRVRGLHRVPVEFKS